jgi:hypothetical protein
MAARNCAGSPAGTFFAERPYSLSSRPPTAHADVRGAADRVILCRVLVSADIRLEGETMADSPPTLSISAEKVCFIAIKAREFDAKDVATVPDEGSNAADDGMRSVLEDRDDDPVVQELTAFIDSLVIDEQVDLVALAWIGRGDGTLDDWNELRAEASRAHSRRTSEYLLGLPLLPSYLVEGLAQFGRSCEEFESGHL